MGEWIKVEDRMPEYGKEVCVYSTHLGEFIDAYYTAGNWRRALDGGLLWDVTKWHELERNIEIADNNGWINVEDGMPPDYEFVLAGWRGCKDAIVAHRWGGRWYSRWYTSVPLLDVPPHYWQPQPKPPVKKGPFYTERESDGRLVLFYGRGVFIGTLLYRGVGEIACDRPNKLWREGRGQDE